MSTNYRRPSMPRVRVPGATVLNEPRASMGGMTVYMDPAPYPEVSGSPNPATVAMLKDDYAGAAGELTGILMYMFQHTSTDNEAYSNAMQQIAVVEMSHLDKLGEAIKALGGDPTYYNGTTPWHASYVNYALSLPDMIRADIGAESTAIETYTRHAAQTDNPTVRALLLRIIEDEKLHLQFFKEALASIS